MTLAASWSKVVYKDFSQVGLRAAFKLVWLDLIKASTHSVPLEDPLFFGNVRPAYEKSFELALDPFPTSVNSGDVSFKEQHHCLPGEIIDRFTE